MIAAVAGLVAAITAAQYSNDEGSVVAFLITFVLVGGCGLAIGAANRRPPPGPPR
jgi:hypothetical protein